MLKAFSGPLNVVDEVNKWLESGEVDEYEVLDCCLGSCGCCFTIVFDYTATEGEEEETPAAEAAEEAAACCRGAAEEPPGAEEEAAAEPPPVAEEEEKPPAAEE